MIKSNNYTEKSTRQRSSGTEVEGNVKTYQLSRQRNQSFISKEEATSTQPVPRGTEIPSREVSPANHYSNQHHPYPRKYYCNVIVISHNIVTSSTSKIFAASVINFP